EGPHRKESGKRGRKPGRKSSDKVDMKVKLVPLVGKEIDAGRIPEGIQQALGDLIPKPE
ncbi:hypothetical protein NQ318_023348, partial [Aromia moschata]